MDYLPGRWHCLFCVNRYGSYVRFQPETGEHTQMLTDLRVSAKFELHQRAL